MFKLTFKVLDSFTVDKISMGGVTVRIPGSHPDVCSLDQRLKKT